MCITFIIRRKLTQTIPIKIEQPSTFWKHECTKYCRTIPRVSHNVWLIARKTWLEFIKFDYTFAV